MHNSPDQPDRSDEGGFTLIELVVAMSVFGAVMVMAMTAVVTLQKDTNRIANEESAVTQARSALTDIDRQVRSGNVLYAPGNELETAGCTATSATATSGNCMRIYTQANGNQRCVQWQVLGTGELRTRSWSATWQTDGIVTSWKTVARGLVTTGGDPFTLQGATTAFSARLLDLRFEVSVPQSSRTVRLDSSLSGRNTNYGYDSGTCRPAPAA